MNGLYIHIPFCKQKCLYCDFVSFRPGCEGDYFSYAAALEQEMRMRADPADGAAFDTVFFGGGTPSLLPIEAFGRICDALHAHFRIRPDAEFTIEANPESITAQKLTHWQEFGANRLSVGVQSFIDAELRSVGRIHDAQTAMNALRAVGAAGFSNLSVDLMCGLPGQTTDSLLCSIRMALDLGVSHVSCYQLQLENGTPLTERHRSGQIDVPDEDAVLEQMHAAVDLLEKNGFLRYEVSNFARPGCESRHNLNYWRRGQYLGLGVAAHSFWGNRRMENTPDFARYLRGETQCACTELSPEDAALEQIMLCLRMREGLPAAALSSAQLARAHFLLQKELLALENGALHATRRGFDVLNQIILYLADS